MIELNGISRHFVVGDQRVDALAQVDLRVDKGEYLAVMGPSGSGKSTLLNVLGLLDSPNAGEYRLDGREVAGLDDGQRSIVRREKIGFVFQFFHLVPRLSAAENIELPMTLAGVPGEERRARVAAAVAAVGLRERAHHRPDQLSGGQRQRVAIARATIMRPKLLLADEPTGNLDQATGQEVLQILEALRAEGMTVMVVTHDPDIGARTQRTLRMVDGRIVDDRRN